MGVKRVGEVGNWRVRERGRGWRGENEVEAEEWRSECEG